MKFFGQWQRALVIALLLGSMVPISVGCKKKAQPPTEQQVEQALEVHRERAQREQDEG